MSPDPTAPATDRQVALAAIDRLPASATLDEMSEELALLAAIRRGIAAADAGRVVTQAEVERRSAEWISR